VAKENSKFGKLFSEKNGNFVTEYSLYIFNSSQFGTICTHKMLMLWCLGKQLKSTLIILFTKMLKFSINTFLKEQNFVKEKLDNIFDFLGIYFFF